MQRRVVIVTGIEGTDSWVESVLGKRGRVTFNRQGTIKEIVRIELLANEEIDLTLLRPKQRSLPR